MLQVSVALTTASVKGVRSAAATHSQYMYIPKKTKKMRLKGTHTQPFSTGVSSLKMSRFAIWGGVGGHGTWLGLIQGGDDCGDED